VVVHILKNSIKPKQEELIKKPKMQMNEEDPAPTK
jgi:hypothetical protein